MEWNASPLAMMPNMERRQAGRCVAVPLTMDDADNKQALHTPIAHSHYVRRGIIITTLADYGGTKRTIEVRVIADIVIERPGWSYDTIITDSNVST